MSVAERGFRVVHFTDTHVMAGGVWPPAGVDTAATLRRVIDVINALDPAPAFAVVGGDLVSPDLLAPGRALPSGDYEPSYRTLRELLAGLRCPAHLLIGNHDDRPAFHRVMGTGAAPDQAQRWSFTHGGYHFVGLDSHVPGRAGGELGPAQLDWLDAELGARAGMPALVFVHHHPWPLGLAWMDSMPLQDGAALLAVLERHPGARWVVCGHVHLDQSVQRGRITMLTTPSTCFQVSKLAQGRRLLPGPPGLRLLDLSPAGLSTRVLHLFDPDPAKL
jgi:Icc protein